MKRHVRLMAIIAALAFPATSRAEHKMVVTDVLNPGQVEVQADVSYDFSIGKDKDADESIARSFRSRLSAATAGLGVGLPGGIEFLVRVPYVFDHKSKSTFPDRSRVSDDYGHGIGDVAAGVKVSFLNERTSGFSLTAGAEIKPQTSPATRGGTGNTHIAFSSAVSTNVQNWYPFFRYETDLANHGARDGHTFAAGVQTVAIPDVFISAEVGGTAYTGTETFSSSGRIFLTAKTAYQLSRNLYGFVAVRPHATLGGHYKKVDVDQDPSRGIAGGVGLYRLF